MREATFELYLFLMVYASALAWAVGFVSATLAGRWIHPRPHPRGGHRVNGGSENRYRLPARPARQISWEG